MFRITISFGLFILSFMATSCGNSNEKELLSYAISSDELETIIQGKANSLLLFWTSWCGGATSRIPQYIQDQNEVTSKGLDIQLILIAADASITSAQIEAHRKAGIQSYYLKGAGTQPFFNRRIIKQFINKLLPGKNLQQLKGTVGNFGIPVELILNEQMEVLNPGSEASSGFLFMCKALGRQCTVENVEVN